MSTSINWKISALWGMKQVDPKSYAQLMEVFQIELDENLQFMTDCLLALEKNPKSKKSSEFIDGLFRAAHTIKGASQGLGLVEIGEISHQLETLFSEFKSGVIKVNTDIFNAIFRAMDCMKESMQGKLKNTPPSFDLKDVLEAIKGTSKKTEKIKEKMGDQSSLFNETIRVSLTKIDTISALSEELQGLKLRNDDLIDRLESTLTEISEGNTEIQTILSELWRSMRDNNTELGLSIGSLQENIRVMRLVPVSVMLHPLMRTVRDIAQRLEKQVSFTTKGDEIEIDRLVLENLKDPLIHLIRNAIDHGIEDPSMRKKNGKSDEGNISIEINEESGRVLISVTDDGMGIDEKRLKEVAVSKNMISPEEAQKLNHKDALNLIFMAGLSTKSIITDLSGRGVGMDVVLHNVHKIKGTLSLKSQIHKGTTVTISVPLTLATDRGMLIKLSGQTFIIPTVSIWRILNLTTEDIHSLEGKKVLHLNNEAIAVYNLAEILKLETQKVEPGQQISVLILYLGVSKIAFLVDSIISEREIAIKSLLPPLSKSQFISGATLSGRGDVILVLSPTDIIAAAQKTKVSGIEIKKELQNKKTKILVVEDSITTRTLEVDILLNRGFDVKSAVNGVEALEMLRKESFDLVITDITMPVMDGFELTEKIKKDEKLKDIPVIMVTSLSKESDRKRGVEVGANAYIIKNQFETKALLSLINDMVS